MADGQETFKWTTRHEPEERVRRDERIQLREPRAERRPRRDERERTHQIRHLPRRDEPMMPFRERDPRCDERAHYRERSRSRERQQGDQRTASPERSPRPPRHNGNLGKGRARRVNI